jgi:hypothetical protein
MGNPACMWRSWDPEKRLRWAVPHMYMHVCSKCRHMQPDPTGSNRIQPDPTGSNRIQPDPTGSNRIQPEAEVSQQCPVYRDALHLGSKGFIRRVEIPCWGQLCGTKWDQIKWDHTPIHRVMHADGANACMYLRRRYLRWRKALERTRLGMDSSAHRPHMQFDMQFDMQDPI